MNNRNQIWKMANSVSQNKCIEMLRLIFPSLSYQFTVTESGLSRSVVDTKQEALKQIRIGLSKITETEASHYIDILSKKNKTSAIKF
jgi:hypothetical protein